MGLRVHPADADQSGKKLYCFSWIDADVVLPRLSHPVAIYSTVDVAASVSGTISRTVTAGAQAGIAVSAAAGLSVPKSLAGAAGVDAILAGEISRSVTLDAALAAVVSGTAVLVVDSSELIATPDVTVSSAGNLTVPKSLAATPGVSAGSSGALSVTKTLVASAGIAVTSTADLLGVIALGASADVTAMVSAGLIAPVTLASAASMVTSLGGDLEVLKSLASDADVATAAAAAMLAEPSDYLLIPLTYDYDAIGGSLTPSTTTPPITPEGLKSGWESEGEVKFTGLPSWLTSVERQDQLSVQLTVAAANHIYDSTYSDGRIFDIGTSVGHKYRLNGAGDEDGDAYGFVQAECYGSGDPIPVFRPLWQLRGQWPELTYLTYEARPQSVYFESASSLVIGAHHEDQYSRLHRIDPDTMEVLASCVTSTYKHIASMDVDSSGNVWCLDYDTGYMLQVDLDESFSTGTLVVDVVYDTSAMDQVSGLCFCDGYALVGEYTTDESARIYVIDEMDLSGTFTLGDEYKWWEIGTRLQGLTIRDGELLVSRNRWYGSGGDGSGEPTQSPRGYIENYGDCGDLITGQADESTLSTSSWKLGPTDYVEDMSAHPTTNEVWMPTEGWEAVGDYNPMMGIWSGNLIDPQSNVVSFDDPDDGSIYISVNGFVMGTYTKSGSETATISYITVLGGEGTASNETAGWVRDVRVQVEPPDELMYAKTKDGGYESSTLTVFDVDLPDPSGDLGSTSNWTDETGGIALRTSTNPVGWDGPAYFYGGPNVQTISRQRVDLVADTDLTTTDLDSGDCYAVLEWWQSSWDDNDGGGLGLRSLDSGVSQITESYSSLDYAPQGSVGTYNWYYRVHKLALATGTRHLDVLYRADRTGGTNNDCYVDNIKLTIYKG